MRKRRDLADKRHTIVDELKGPLVATRKYYSTFCDVVFRPRTFLRNLDEKSILEDRYLACILFATVNQVLETGVVWLVLYYADLKPYLGVSVLNIPGNWPV